MKLGNEFLYDTWEVSGDDYDEYISLIKEVNKATKFVLVNTAELEFLCGNHKSESAYRCVVLNEAIVYDFGATLAIENEENIPLKGIDSGLFEESMMYAGFIMRHQGQLYYFSENALPSLFTKARLNGDAMYNSSVIRTLHLMLALRERGLGLHSRRKSRPTKQEQEQEQNCVLVTRTIGGHHKVFFVATEKYAPIPITEVVDFADAVCDEEFMGKAEVRHWSISHASTSLIITFPQKGKDIKNAYGLKDDILPGLLITTSDTGTACFTVQSIAYVHGTRYITLETMPRKHTGNIDIGTMRDEVEAMMFRNFKKLPELLCALLAKPVLSGREKTGGSKTRIIMSAYSKGLKGAYYQGTKKSEKRTLRKILGDHREREVRETLYAEIDPDAVWTYYDIVMNILEIPDRIKEVPDGMKNILASALGRVPFVFEDIVDGTAIPKP